MSTHSALRLGITALSVVALVATGAVPASGDPAVELTGVADPLGVAFTAGGDSLVANHAGGSGASVAVFTGASTTPDPARTLKGVTTATGIAVSPVNGDVLVTDWWAGAVYTFHAGQATPDAALTRTVPGAFDVEVDQDGEVYVSSPLSSTNRVYVFPAASLTASRALAVGRVPRGLAVHPATGEIYVGSELDQRVHIYAHGADAFDPARDLAGAAGNPLIPWGIAIHPASGNAYVVDKGDDLVVVYEPGVGTPSNSLNMSTGWDTQGVGINPITGAVYRSSFDLDKVFITSGPTMSVASVAPASGPITGGTAVTITGANLAAVTSVTFNGIAGEIVGRPEPTRVVVKVPAAAAAGKVAVQVAWAGNTAGRSDAFEYTAVAPGPATGLKVTPGNGRVDVTWTAPAFTGGVPVQGYLVTPSPSGAPCATTERDCTIAGLTNGQKYRFTVTTTNTAGLSSVSDPVEATPYLPIKQTVKAKKASSKLPRKGYATAVNWVKKPKYASLAFTTSCSVPKGLAGAELASSQLCKFTTYKTGKVKVRTKGYKNVQVQVSIQSLPNSKAAIQYGPSTTWTRTWLVR